MTTITEAIDSAKNKGIDTRLYTANQHPHEWIAKWRGELVCWPASDGGWAKRKPWDGLGSLREVEPSNAAGTGWPVVQP